MNPREFRSPLSTREAALKELQGKPQYVELLLDRAAVDVEARTVDLAFCSEAPYER